MKKLLLTGAVALFGLSNAQIAKGTVYVSGQLGFSQESNNNTDKKVSEINIIPTVGYFVNTNLAVGLGVGYKNAKTTTEVNDSQTIGNITTTSVGKTKDINDAIVVEPFVRKYWTIGEKLYIFGQLSVPMEFGSGKDKNELTTTVSSSTGTPATTTTTTSTSVDKAKSTSIGVAVKPGLDYFLNKNWTIEATIGEFGYNNKKYDIDGAKSVDNYNFGLNLSTVTIGVKYVFSK
ncbi:outer membrane beta-barrel protein [Chryseobacterium luteum]|uniref:Opacity protein n=1 Tax=Chryseobacterium luteum TaxID=421531 RepID=A0A085ZAT8_9FLAO|nr:outer membrane beta-barrel protein [Chryseobacterium luteum]KFF01552.1 opacity protein [Chryseobacterium luteum]